MQCLYIGDGKVWIGVVAEETLFALCSALHRPALILYIDLLLFF